MPLITIAFVAAAYLIGSISTAVIVCKLMGLPDPRAEGSGNPGATNVLRIGGKKAAAITLLGDTLKGLLPTLAAYLLHLDPLALALVGLAAFIGHLFPIFFGFKGGKGVATLLGVLFGFHWVVGLATALTWLIIAKVFRISSIAGLIAALLAPLYVWLIRDVWLHWGAQHELIIATGIMTIILIWRHRSNIQNLWSGKEGKIGNP